jgi:hypothetical protein
MRIPLGLRYNSPAEFFRDLTDAANKNLGIEHQGVRLALQILGYNPSTPGLTVKVPEPGEGKIIVVNGERIDFGAYLSSQMLKPFNPAYDSRQWLLNERESLLELLSAMDARGELQYIAKIEVHINWATLDGWFPSKMLHEAYHMGQLREFLNHVRARPKSHTSE